MIERKFKDPLSIFTDQMKFLKFKTRYKYWQVLVTFLCIGLVGGLVYLIFRAFEPKEALTAMTDHKGENSSSGFGSFLGFWYFITFFYFALNYFYNLIAARKKFWEYFRIVAVIVFASFIYHSFLYYYFPSELRHNYSSLNRMFWVMFFNMCPMFIMSFLFAYVTYLWESQKQRRILEAQKLQLESQISQANFNFLKAQINPHFLHNTLNFLYARSLPYDAELSEGILTLSDIMRYALSQGNQKDGKVPLKDEIEHVHNVIKISQLRYSHQLKVNFDVKGNVDGEFIIPFVLITIVENAFKHGDLKSPENPIDIKLTVSENKKADASKGYNITLKNVNQLYFYCRNKKKAGPKQLGTGIGLENIDKRLQLAYGDDYKFTVNDEPDFYTTELTIYKL